MRVLRWSGPIVLGLGCGGFREPPPILIDTDGPMEDTNDDAGEWGESGDTGASLDAPELAWVENVGDAVPFDMSTDAIGSVYVLAAHGISYAGDGYEYEEVRLHRWAVDGLAVFTGVVDDARLVAVGEGGIALASPLFDGTGTSDVWALDGAAQAAWRTNVAGGVEDLAMLSDGSLIAVGTAPGATANDVLGWAQRIEADGTPGWTQTFGDPTMRASVVETIEVEADDTITIAGRLGVSPSSSQSEAWVARIGADGQEIWSATLSAGVVTDRVPDVAAALGGWTSALVFADVTSVVHLDAGGNDVRTDPFPWEGRSAERIGPGAGGGIVLGTAVPRDTSCEGPQCATDLLVRHLDSLGYPEWEAERPNCSAPFGLSYWAGDNLVDPHTLVTAACGDGFAVIAFGDTLGW